MIFFRNLSIVIILIFSFSSVEIRGQALEKVVEGTIVDRDGNPYIGASVLLKGTASGAVTDMDGNFSLALPSNSISPILVISYTGFNTYEIIPNNLQEEEIDVSQGMIVETFLKNKYVCPDGDVFIFPERSDLMLARFSSPMEWLLTAIKNKKENKAYKDQLDLIHKRIKIYLDQVYFCLDNHPPCETQIRSRYREINKIIKEGNELLTDLTSRFLNRQKSENGIQSLQEYLEKIDKLEKVVCN